MLNISFLAQLMPFKQCYFICYVKQHAYFDKINDFCVSGFTFEIKGIIPGTDVRKSL